MNEKTDDYYLGWLTGRTESFAEHVTLRRFHELLESKPWQTAESCWLEAIRLYGGPMLRNFDALSDSEKLSRAKGPELRRWTDNIRNENLADMPRYLR